MDIDAAVLRRITALGYEPTGSAQESSAIRHAVDRAEQWILNNINWIAVPSGLLFIWADMAAGWYLLNLKSAGQLIGDAFDFGVTEKTVSEGDTSVTFMGASDGVLSAEAQFDNLLRDMLHPPEEQLAAYRRMKW